MALAIAKWRQEAGLSKSALARAAGVSVRTLRRIENDADYSPNVGTLCAIADALGVPLDSLVVLHADDSNRSARSAIQRRSPGRSITTTSATGA